MDHVLIKPTDPHSHNEDSLCAICDGGLAICKLCGKAEAELDEPCVPRVTQSNGDIERETLIYWLLRAYQSGHREGWEDGPSADETMDGICSVLANRGYDPNLSDAAKELLRQPPRY